MHCISQGLLLGVIYLHEFFLFLTNGVSNNSSLHERRLYRVCSLSWLSYKYRTVRQVFDRLIGLHNSVAICSNMCLQEYTRKPRYNEGHSYWQKCALTRINLLIEVLSHTFYYFRNIVRFPEYFAIWKFVIWRFHCISMKLQFCVFRTQLKAM